MLMWGILGYLAWFGALACFLIVLVRQFNSAGVFSGVIGILTFGIWTFIWGWINARDENILSVMLGWSFLVAIRLLRIAL
jgi:hypothetical protein